MVNQTKTKLNVHSSYLSQEALDRSLFVVYPRLPYILFDSYNLPVWPSTPWAGPTIGP